MWLKYTDKLPLRVWDLLSYWEIYIEEGINNFKTRLFSRGYAEQTYTSLSALNTWSWMASGDIHLIGSFLLFLEWYTFPVYTSRDNPKSATFTSLPSQTRTFLAARLRWMNPFLDKNSYVKEEKES